MSTQADSENIDHSYHFNYSQLYDIWNILYALSDSTFSSVEISLGKKGRYGISCEAMMSAMNTVTSIDFCCSRNAYSDAYTLVRKYRDDLLQYLFLLNLIKSTHGLTDDELKNFPFNEESLVKILELDFKILTSGERKSTAQFAMESWMYNDLDKSNNSKTRKDFFDASKYKKDLIGNNDRVKYLFANFFNSIWTDTDRTLNNYVHTNGKKYLTDNYIYQKNKREKDQELINNLQRLTDIFLCLLAVIDSTKMHSSDYMDYMEMGTQPPEGCQYWVCPCIIDYMNNRFDSRLLTYIQTTDVNGMKFKTSEYKNV